MGEDLSSKGIRMSNGPQTAHEYHVLGYNCAQSILATFAEECGVSGDVAFRISAPFGGGMGRAGEVCGAVSGALMVIGLSYGRGQPETKEAIYRMAREFIADFQSRHGALRCSELLGHDISAAAGLQAAKDAGAFSTICPGLVNKTAQALSQYLKDNQAISTS